MSCPCHAPSCQHTSASLNLSEQGVNGTCVVDVVAMALASPVVAPPQEDATVTAASKRGRRSRAPSGGLCKRCRPSALALPHAPLLAPHTPHPPHPTADDGGGSSTNVAAIVAPIVAVLTVAMLAAAFVLHRRRRAFLAFASSQNSPTASGTQSAAGTRTGVPSPACAACVRTYRLARRRHCTPKYWEAPPKGPFCHTVLIATHAPPSADATLPVAPR